MLFSGFSTQTAFGGLRCDNNHNIMWWHSSSSTSTRISKCNRRCSRNSRTATSAWIVSTVCQGGHGPSVAPSSSQKPPLYPNFGGMAINSNGSKCGKLSALAATWVADTNQKPPLPGRNTTLSFTTNLPLPPPPPKKKNPSHPFSNYFVCLQDKLLVFILDELGNFTLRSLTAGDQSITLLPFVTISCYQERQIRIILDGVVRFGWIRIIHFFIFVDNSHGFHSEPPAPSPQKNPSHPSSNFQKFPPIRKTALPFFGFAVWV